MRGFYLLENKYKERTITFIYHYRSNSWYIPRNELIEILYNPKSASSYWCHLRKKYLKQNINIDKITKTIKVTSKDNKQHPKKLLTINNALKIIKLSKKSDNDELINYLKNINFSLSILENELQLDKIINNYISLGHTKKQITDKFLTILNKK